MMNNYDISNKAKFVPTIEQWGEYYNQWSKDLEYRLACNGNEDECREAVIQAFQKVMGISDRFHLLNPNEPRRESHWRNYVLMQAKAILSHKRDQAKRFTSLDAPTINQMNGQNYAIINMMAETKHRSDRQWVSKALIRAVKQICHSAGIKESICNAFLMFMLDEMSGKDVVKAVPEVHNRNNLYQIKNRIMKLLISKADSFPKCLQDLLIA